MDDQIVNDYPADTNEQKMQVPYIEKSNGNICFKKQEIEEALKHYAKALMAAKILFQDQVIQSQEDGEKIINDIDIPCNTNMALCYIKIKGYANAIYHADRVLSIKPNNTKALYRRGVAFMETGEFERSKNDLKLAISQEPNNAEIREAWDRLKEKKRQYKEREQELSRKMIKNRERRTSLNNITEEESLEAEAEKPGWIMRLILWLIGLYVKMLFRPVFLFLSKIKFVMKMINWGINIARFLYVNIWLRFHGVFSFCLLAPISFVLGLCFKRRRAASSGSKVD